MSMILNYAAGFVSFMLAISAFTPWVTIWFYSLKGIESLLGIAVLLVGFLGAFIAVFQHLSGNTRGRGFIGVALLSIIFEALYFKKLADYGEKLNEIVGLLKDLFGDALVLKLQEMLGEQWVKIAGRILARFSPDGSLSAFDFIGGGLLVALISSALLLCIGIVLETRKESTE